MAFEFQPIHNQYAGTIADIMEHSADAQAAAIRAKGDAWAHASENIGQIIGALPREIQQQKAAGQEAQIRDLQLTEAKRQADNAAIVDHTKKGIAALMSDPSVMNDDGTFNVKGITDKLSQMPPGAQGPASPIDVKTIADTLDPINTSLLAAKENGLKYQQTKANALAGLAAGALRLGKVDGNYFSHAAYALGAAQKGGLMSEDEATQTLAHLVENRDQIPSILEDFVSRSTVPPIKMGEGDTLVNGLDPTQVLARGTPKPKTRAELAADAANPNSSTQQQSTDALAKMTPAPNSEKTEFQLDGKTVVGDYLPGQSGQPGKYLYNGQDVTARATAKPPAPAMTADAANDVKEAVAGMKDGTIPPQLPGRATKEYTATLAEAHRQGYDLQAAVTDWNATQKHIATLNGQQQTRLQQSINALPELLDSVDALASKWKGGKFPPLNRVNLALAKNGAFGDDVASVARQLDSQIADVTSDLGAVYMGGNTPTDQALQLAGKALSGDWSEKVLHDLVARARSNVAIRSNSIKNTGVAGASANNPYAPPAAAPAAAQKNPFR